MPILLKNIKRSLERDLNKVGFKNNGDYKYTPPNIVARKLSSYPNLPVKQPDGTPNFKKGEVVFAGLVQSQTSGDKYKVYAKFHGVPFFPDKDPKHAEEEQMVAGGKILKMYRAPITIRESPVSLRCQCMDFQHRFSWELAGENALYGGPPVPYTRKTPAWPKGRPYANSTEKIGICKHINSFLNELNRLGMIEE